MKRRAGLLIVIDFIYYSEGTENQVIKLINNIDASKYEVHLLCLRNTPWLEANRSKLNCSITAFNYNIYRHNDPGNVKVYWQVVRTIKNIGPDIAMAFFKISYMLGVLAARLAGVPNIISTRRDFGLWLDGRSIYILRFANRFVKRIVANSYAVKELVSKEERFDSEKISVIYNGIDVRAGRSSADGGQQLKQDLGISSDSKVVGIVAGLRPMKKHRTFLKAAKRVLILRKGVHFVLVGDGPLRTDLEAFTRELNIENNVHFVGWQHTVDSYLNMFDIGVNCSTNEGLSNAIMEYMLSGVPSIVSSAGGNPELIEDGVNGYAFDPDDHETLAKLILELLRDALKREEFSVRSKELIRTKFGLQNMVQQYDSLFTELLGPAA